MHFLIESWSFLSTFSVIHFRRSSTGILASFMYLSSTFGRNTFFDFFTIMLAWRNSLLAASSSSLILVAVYTLSYKEEREREKNDVLFLHFRNERRTNGRSKELVIPWDQKQLLYKGKSRQEAGNFGVQTLN